MGPTSSNKSIIEELPTVGEARVQGTEAEPNLSNISTGLLSSWTEDNMSTVEGLLGAGGVPIDKRSSKTSLPLFWAWLPPKIYNTGKQNA